MGRRSGTAGRTLPRGRGGRWWPGLLCLLGGLLTLAAGPARAAGPEGPATVRVRVLEAKRLASARLETHEGSFACDGAPTPTFLARVKVHGTKVELPSGVLCARVSAADVSVAVSAREERRYRGVLEVSADHGVLRFLDLVPLEEYLGAVVARELSGDYEAMKAQAVVARTYALANLHRHQAEGYDLCDLTHCQLYPGRGSETADSLAAVAATTGQVLHLKGQLVPVFFHQNCGGHTSSARDVFGELGAGLPVAEPLFEGAPACGKTPDFRWSWEVPRAQLARALGLKPQGPAYQPLTTDVGGRVIEARLFGRALSGRELLARVTKAFGYSRMRSLKFSAQEVGGRVRFSGFGSGHGVGLCQQGALSLAQHGYGYQKILSHYFPESEVVSPP